MSTVINSVIAILIVTLLGACSNNIELANNQDGTCIQTRKSTFLGMTYSTNRNLVNCDKEAR